MRGPQKSRTAAEGVAGKAIRAMRTAMGLTVKEFGRRVGVSHPIVCRWETDVELPSLQSAIRIGAIAEGDTRAWWREYVVRRLRGNEDAVRAFLVEVGQ
jgi:transcriptional regulator with XRE-family HTH domain